MEKLKEKVARAAIEYINEFEIIGVGSGSTVNCFIDALEAVKHRIEGCVASSLATAERLKRLGIPVLDLNVVDELPLYIDGADEVTPAGEMIKGGGGALTREKIVATVAHQFICIVDESKVVQTLGSFPLAIEVIPLARSFVARELVKLGGDPQYREGFITDNGNIILDVFNFAKPLLASLENTIKQIPGVVENGLFMKRRANLILVGCANKVDIITP